MNLYLELLSKPVFKIEDVNYYYNNINSARSAVQRMLKSGKIKKIRNNMYTCTIGNNEETNANRFQIGSAINEKAYISHHSAMEYYGITNQVYNCVYVSSEMRFNDFEFDGYRYIYIPSNISIGIQDLSYSGGVRITDKERTVIDSIKDVDKIAGYEEILNNLSDIGYLNETLLLSYLKKYNNKFLYQKVGYLLSKEKIKHGLSSSFFKECKNNIGNSKRYLFCGNSQKFYDSYWQLIIDK